MELLDRENLLYQKALERYTKGFLVELGDSAYSTDTLHSAAQEDFDHYLYKVEEEAGEAGWERGYDQMSDDEESEIYKLRHDNETLKRRVEEGEKEIIAKLSYFFGKIAITTPPPTDNVEAWAHQDGWNEVIQEAMTELTRLTEVE
jgi:hypothetical protein